MAQAQTAAVLQTRGTVTFERGGVSIAAASGTELQEADVLVAQPQAEALLSFADGARMAVRGDSAVDLQDLPRAGATQRRRTRIRIIKGGVRYLSGANTITSQVSFATHTATIGIRGTDIEIALPAAGRAADPGTYLKVNSGVAVLAALDGASVEVGAGEVALGAEPDLRSRGLGARRPAARKLAVAPSDVFRPGDLDAGLR
jgi:hypothetical protein